MALFFFEKLSTFNHEIGTLIKVTMRVMMMIMSLIRAILLVKNKSNNDGILAIWN